MWKVPDGRGYSRSGQETEYMVGGSSRGSLRCRKNDKELEVVNVKHKGVCRYTEGGREVTSETVHVGGIF